MLLPLLALLAAPAAAQTPSLEDAFAALRPAAAAAAKRVDDRRGWQVPEIDADADDWKGTSADACAHAKELDAWTPTLVLAGSAKPMPIKLSFKGCLTMDKPGTDKPAAARLYAAEGSPWGVMLGTEVGSDRTVVTLVREDAAKGWRQAKTLGERPTAELVRQGVIVEPASK